MVAERVEQKTTLAARAKDKLDAAMRAKGIRPHARRLVWHYLNLLWQQLGAMLPITLLQVLVLAIFFQQGTPTPGLEAAGLISAVVGLVLFLDGLRVAIMPMAMLVGTQLPVRLKLFWVLLVAFCLGVLVTYAEPAIAAIRPLAALVDPQSAPYLYYMMNQQQEIMVLAIGMGVGVASVIGTLKFLYGWSLKVLIALTLLPTVGAACYMQWGNTHLRPLLGVAWDCGAVTTGPVTVPVLLSLGVGVMTAQKQKKAALAVLEDMALKKSEGNTLEGFGIVTLASLLPVLAVELLAIITGAVHPYDYVLEQAQIAFDKTSNAILPPAELSPVKEIVYGIRAITPLLCALALLVVVVLRQPLPAKGFIPDADDDEAEDESQGQSTEGSSKRSAPYEGSGGSRDNDVEFGSAKALDQNKSVHKQRKLPPAAERHSSVAEAAILSAGKADAEYYALDTLESSSAADTFSEGGESTGSHMDSVKSFFSKYASVLVAMLMCQIGMILFNIGLTYGFSALGDMTGVTLPTAFLQVPYDPKSPRYSFAGGVTLTMATIFLLGILATKAEPALNVLGDTVETLSGGKFTKRALIWSVCVGVAVGMCAGGAKILFELPLIWFILVKYAVASGLTAAARESITAVAWDSAGVTTGPVTVPFVLAIGIGFSKAAGAPEGFGMLTVMSVAPIISVLLTSLVSKPVVRASTELARVSKVGLAKVSRSLYTRSRALADGYGNGDPADLPRIGEHSIIQPDAAQSPAAPDAVREQDQA